MRVVYSLLVQTQFLLLQHTCNLFVYYYYSFCLAFCQKKKIFSTIFDYFLFPTKIRQLHYYFFTDYILYTICTIYTIYYKNNNFARSPSFFVHCRRCTKYNVKVPNFTLFEDGNTRQSDFRMSQKNGFVKCQLFVLSANG